MGNSDRNVRFSLGGMTFEYDKEKNLKNIEKHGISFRNAARVFFDYDRIEMYDVEHSENEERYNTIGSIGTSIGAAEDILFVVYTERAVYLERNERLEVTRMISARMATSFERGLYYGKYN